MKEALAAGDFQVDLLSKQPNLNKGLYGYMDPRNGKLITSQEFSGDDIYANKTTTLKSDLDQYLFYYDNESDGIQPYANLGVPLAFMCYLHNATGSTSYLDAAMKLFEFLDHAGDRCWVDGQTTKVLWGLALLHSIRSATTSVKRSWTMARGLPASPSMILPNSPSGFLFVWPVIFCFRLKPF
jgi:hypothetical protein